MRRCPRESEGIFFMGYVQGEGRTQAILFPVTLEELIPDDHVCRVIDAFVDRLDMAGLGFERAEAAETGRPGYDPRDLLKLYLYGYLQQIRSSRRLESECRRNIELMWLLGRLAPDHKTIAEFRRMHRDGVTAAGAELVRLARSVGLVKGEWVAIDGSKFQAVSSVKSVREREALERYLNSWSRAMSKTRWSSTPVLWPVRWKNCTGTRSRKLPSCAPLTASFLPTTYKRPSMPNTR
jgi:transposase